MKVELEKLRVMNLEKGDIIVVEGIKTIKKTSELSDYLKCKVLIVPDINKIGVLKFKKD